MQRSRSNAAVAPVPAQPCPYSYGVEGANEKLEAPLPKLVRLYFFRMLWLGSRVQQSLQKGALALQLLLLATVLLGAALIAFAWHSHASAHALPEVRLQPRV
jgi:hypothetical protein